MLRASNVVSAITFADDTNLFLTHKNTSEMFRIMNLELNKFNDWFKSNKLSINTDTAENSFYFMIQAKVLIFPLNYVILKLITSELNRKNDLKFLGVIIVRKYFMETFYTCFRIEII